MLYFVSGPVDKDFVGGILDNWHLEVYNNSNCDVSVTLKAFDVNKEPPVLIGNTTRTVESHSHQYITLNTNLCEHTVAQIEYSEDFAGNILLTLYGRDKIGKGLPGAIFSNNQLIELYQGLII